MNMQTMMPAMVFYFLLAVAFIWLGIGLACARRWAWTLTVVLSWMWLLIGVVRRWAVFVSLRGADDAGHRLRNSETLPPEVMMASHDRQRCVPGLCLYHPAGRISHLLPAASPCARLASGEIRRSPGPIVAPCRCSPSVSCTLCAFVSCRRWSFTGR